ncbi:MAG: hypothetical protein WCH39_20840, partial [Schlesneria sp.]
TTRDRVLVRERNFVWSSAGTDDPEQRHRPDDTTHMPPAWRNVASAWYPHGTIVESNRQRHQPTTPNKRRPTVNTNRPQTIRNPEWADIGPSRWDFGFV